MGLFLIAGCSLFVWCGFVCFAVGCWLGGCVWVVFSFSLEFRLYVLLLFGCGLVGWIIVALWVFGVSRWWLWWLSFVGCRLVVFGVEFCLRLVVCIGALYAGLCVVGWWFAGGLFGCLGWLVNSVVFIDFLF